MLEVLHQLAGGFASLTQLANIIALAVGLVVGMLVAVLPGLTLVMGVVPGIFLKKIEPSA